VISFLIEEFNASKTNLFIYRKKAILFNNHDVSMKNYFLIFIIFILFHNCKPRPECIHGEPFIKVSFEDKTTGLYLDSTAMKKISVKGVGAGTAITNYSTFNQKYFYPGFSDLLIPLNIGVDSSMFIIKNGALTDTILFYYRREHEFQKRNCDGKKGTYVVNAKDLKIGYSTLDSFNISNYNNYDNENYYLIIYY
jgi:hypothetical protein